MLKDSPLVGISKAGEQHICSLCCTELLHISPKWHWHIRQGFIQFLNAITVNVSLPECHLQNDSGSYFVVDSRQVTRAVRTTCPEVEL